MSNMVTIGFCKENTIEVTEEKYKSILYLLEHAKCPKCGERVFMPAGYWQKYTDGRWVSPENPVVWCRDMGHWYGQLSDCSQDDARDITLEF